MKVDLNMKLYKELEQTVNCFMENAEKIKEYAIRLKMSGEYKDFETRLAWDCIRYFRGVKTIYSWYDKYNCNDKHITTLGKRALKEIGVI